MASNGDLVRLVYTYSHLGKSMVNVFWYVVGSGTEEMQDIVQQFSNDVVIPVLAVQQNQCLASKLEGFNETDGAGYAVLNYPPTVLGQRPGERAPSFVAYAFRLNRETRLTRHGQKRIGGVSESDIEGNNPIGAVIPLLNDLATAMAGNMVTPSGAVLSPVIRGVDKQTQAVILNDVDSVEFTRVTSQVSRK